KLIITVIIGVTAVILIALVVVMLLSRARGPSPTVPMPPVSTQEPTENEPTVPEGSGGQDTTPEWDGGELGMVVSDDIKDDDVNQPQEGTFETVIDPSLNRLLTEQEKKEAGYPSEWSVRVRAYTPPGGGD